MFEHSLALWLDVESAFEDECVPVAGDMNWPEGDVGRALE